MSLLLKTMLTRYMAPADEAGADTGGTDTATLEDRGDAHTPTDDEPEATAQPEDTPEGEEQPGTDAALDEPKPQAIPKARFDQVNNARKQAEIALATANEELARYREMEAAAKAAPAPAPAQSAAPAPADQPASIKAQEKAYAAALMEGDVDKAIEIRESINAQIAADATQRATVEISARQSAQLLHSTAESVSKAYPYLNTPDGAEALAIIVASRDAKIAKGMPAHLALLEAANAIAPRFAPDEAPSGVSAKAEPAKDSRTSAALARGAEDSAAQPPALQVGIGARATAARVNVAQMTEAQFEALTPAEKSRLRGD